MKRYWNRRKAERGLLNSVTKVAFLIVACVVGMALPAAADAVLVQKNFGRAGELRLSRVFTDHMVLQRGKTLQVKGVGPVGAEKPQEDLAPDATKGWGVVSKETALLRQRLLARMAEAGDPVPVIEDAPVRKSGQRRVDPVEIAQL